MKLHPWLVYYWLRGEKNKKSSYMAYTKLIHINANVSGIRLHFHTHTFTHLS